VDIEGKNVYVVVHCEQGVVARWKWIKKNTGKKRDRTIVDNIRGTWKWCDNFFFIILKVVNVLSRKAIVYDVFFYNGILFTKGSWLSLSEKYTTRINLRGALPIESRVSSPAKVGARSSGTNIQDGFGVATQQPTGTGHKSSS